MTGNSAEFCNISTYASTSAFSLLSFPVSLTEVYDIYTSEELDFFLVEMWIFHVLLCASSIFHTE